MVLHCVLYRRLALVLSLPFFCLKANNYLVEVIAYIARIILANQSPNWTLGVYIINSVLALVAPAVFAASIYMELGRIVEVVEGDHHLFIRRRWLTATFVTGDVISFFVQGGGT